MPLEKLTRSSIRKIYEDESILVIDKPPGFVVDSSITQKEATLVDWLRKNYGTLIYHSEDAEFRRGVVHRLDKDTSGVILVAKNQKAFENLQKQFKERKVKKEYIALVHGLIVEGGVVEGGIGRNPVKREKFTVTSDGKEAVTEYEPAKLLVMSSEFVEQTFSDFNKIQLRKLRTMNYQLYTLLVVRPKTGRTHQIRVHLKYIAHSIVSDEKYAGRKIYRLDKRWCPRMFLHAKKISFKHPTSGKWVQFQSPLPDDLENALNKLEPISKRHREGTK